MTNRRASDGSVAQTFIAIDRDWRYTDMNGLALERIRKHKGEHLQRENLLGKNVWEVFPEAVGTELHRRYEAAMASGRPAELESYYAPSGEWIEVHAYPSAGGLEIYSREVSGRRAAEHDRQRAADEQELVAELGLRALGHGDLQALLDHAVVLTAKTLDVEIAGVAQLMPAGDMLLRAGVGWDPGAVGSGTGSGGESSLVGYTVQVGQPVVSEDVEADPRFEISPLLREHRPTSAASVLIAGRDEAFGALGVFSRGKRSFSAREVNFLQAVANALAVAVQTAETEDRMAEVRDAERRRMARDLHDEALQDLTDALAALARVPGSAQTEALPALQRVSRHLRSAIYDLRLSADETRSFSESLETLVDLHDDVSEGSPTELHLEAGIATASLGRGGTEALQIVGEALVNVRRHANATTVTVVAGAGDDCLSIEVSDDGDGFDTALTPKGTSIGIAGMRERAALLGAALEIRSRPGEGTLVRVEIPLDGQAQPTGVRVLLVEDHVSVRQALAEMIGREPEFEVVGQASTLDEARSMLDDVDLALVDLGLPDGYGGELIRELRRTNPGAQAVVLSANLDRTDVGRAVESGAAAVLDKSAHITEVVEAMRRVQAGETMFDLTEVMELTGQVRRKREEEQQERRAIDSLTPREGEILQALAEGLSSQEIARRLHITLRTERNHIANILYKLGMHSQLQALVFALRYDLVEIR